MKSRKPIITEGKFLKAIKDREDIRINSFKNGLSGADKPKEFWKTFKASLQEKLGEILNDKKYSQEDINPFVGLSLSENQPDFNYYKSLLEIYKNSPQNKIDIQDLIEYVAIRFANDEVDILFQDYSLTHPIEVNRFEISTQTIYQNLGAKWHELNREFISGQVQNALMSILNEEVPMSVSIDYVNRCRKLAEIADDPNNFPIPRLYLKRINQKNKNLCFVVSFEEMDGIVLKDNAYFDLLFAIQFFLTDLMEADNFLLYHLDNNFEGDINNYKWFLEILMFKYDFLSEKYKELIGRFVTHNKSIAETEKSVNKTQRVFALKFLLASFAELSTNELTDMMTARIADFLIEGRNVDNIKNTYSYRVISRFHSKSKKSKIEDLKAIRGFYETLSMDFELVLGKIDSEISWVKKEKKNL